MKYQLKYIPPDPYKYERLADAASDAEWRAEDMLNFAKKTENPETARDNIRMAENLLRFARWAKSVVDKKPVIK